MCNIPNECKNCCEVFRGKVDTRCMCVYMIDIPLLARVRARVGSGVADGGGVAVSVAVGMAVSVAVGMVRYIPCERARGRDKGKARERRRSAGVVWGGTGVIGAFTGAVGGHRDADLGQSGGRARVDFAKLTECSQRGETFPMVCLTPQFDKK